MIGPAPASRNSKVSAEEEEEESTDSASKPAPGRLSKGRNQRPADDEVSNPRAKALEAEEEEDEFGETDKSPVSVAKKAPAKAGKAAKPGPGGLPVSPKVLIIAGAAVVLLGIIGTVVAIAAGSSNGSMMITVEPATAKVVLRVDDQPVIDGQPVKPDTIIKLEPGPHKVVAAAEGFARLEQVVNVTEGKSPLMVQLKLKPEGAESPPDKQPDEPAKDPDEARDPPKTPPDEVAKNPDTPAEPEKPKTFAAVFVGDAGAEILVDGKPVGQTPNAKALNLAVGKTYKFQARRAGYKPLSGELKYGGSPELEVEVELEKEEAKPAPPPQPTPPKPVVNTPKPAPAKLGKFAASTKPAGAQIWVDGKYSGRDTPVAIGNPLLLPLGSRKIVFKLNGKQTKPQTVTITEAEVAKLINVPVE
jgi:hypothetical protein